MVTARLKRVSDVEQATEPRFSSVSVTGMAEPEATGLAFAVAVMSRSRQAGMSIVVPSVSRPSAVASWPPLSVYPEASRAPDWTTDCGVD